jgi:hypothetical protein
MKLATSMSPAEHVQRPSLEGVALTNDGYLVGISSKVVVVGSLSSGSSITSVMNGCWAIYRWTKWFFADGFKLGISRWTPCSQLRRVPPKAE